MARYGQVFKDKAVSRLLPPESVNIDAVSHELSVSVSTLERWRADALASGKSERGLPAAMMPTRNIPQSGGASGRTWRAACRC